MAVETRWQKAARAGGTGTRAAQPWRGVVAGLVGGLAGAWVMNQVGPALERIFAGDARDGDGHEPGGEEETQPDPKVRVAETAAAGVLGHSLTRRQRELAGPVVHYGFGGTLGAVYGGLGELFPALARGAGLPYGAAVWLGADEAALPALGLTEPPTTYPLSSHAHALPSHLVYGAATDLVRRLVRRAL